MTDYTKLVEALRYCGNFTEREGCDESCEYFNDMDCPNRIMSDTAAAIEELEAEVRKYHDAFGRLSKTAVELEQRIAELKGVKPQEVQE